MKIAAIYARTSTDEQVDGYGAWVQIDESEKMATRLGFTNLEHFTTDALENGISGLTFDRPGTKALYRFLTDNPECKDVFVYDASRLGRDEASCFYHFKRFLIDTHGVTVHLSRKNKSFNKGNWDLSAALEGIIAAEDYRKITEMLKSAKQRTRLDGKPATRIDALGYTRVTTKKAGKKDTHLVKDPVYQETIEIIFNKYLNENSSTYTIAKYLNLHGYKCKSGEWNYIKIRTILFNAFVYSGFWYQGVSIKVKNYYKRIPYSEIQRKVTLGEIIPFTNIDPYITREQADKILEKLSKARKTASGAKPIHKALLRGLCFCGLCGSRSHIRPQMSGNKLYIYYVCGDSTKKHYNRLSECAGHGTIPEKDIDNLVYDAVINTVSKEYLVSVIQHQNEIISSDISLLEIQRLKIQQIKFNKDLERYEADYLSGDISSKQLKTFTEATQEKITAILDIISKLEQILPIDNTQDIQYLLENIHEIQDRLRNTTDTLLKNELLRELKVRVLLYPEKRIVLEIASQAASSIL
jgi:site-specific DNA recombinase